MPSSRSAQKESTTGTDSVVVWTGIQCWCSIICSMINEANCSLMQNVNHASLRLCHLPSLCVDDADCLVREGFRSNHLFQKEPFVSEGIIVSEGTILHECRYEHWFSILHHRRVTGSRHQSLTLNTFEGCTATMGSNAPIWSWCKRGAHGSGQNMHVRNYYTYCTHICENNLAWKKHDIVGRKKAWQTRRNLKHRVIPHEPEGLTPCNSKRGESKGHCHGKFRRSGLDIKAFVQIRGVGGWVTSNVKHCWDWRKSVIIGDTPLDCIQHSNSPFLDHRKPCRQSRIHNCS